jgi:hypothetical protein
MMIKIKMSGESRMRQKIFFLGAGLFPLCVAAQQLPEPVIQLMQNEAFAQSAASIVAIINQTPLTGLTAYLGDIYEVRQDANLPPLTPDYRDYYRLLEQGAPPARAYVGAIIPDCLQTRSCGLGEGVRLLGEQE